MGERRVTRHRVGIVGAGFGGLGLAIRLRRAGIDDVVVFEADDGVGGTWRANRYPGAACDVPSHLYSFSFALKADWQRTYATQPEILDYLEDCTDRFGVRPSIRCGTPVVRAEWREADACWRLTDGDGNAWDTEVLVPATGMLRVPRLPRVEGLERFAGPVVHSARWPTDLELRGRRVAVIGTGASAVQIVPAIAGTAAGVDVYQRSPAWIMPRIDRPFTGDEQAAFAADPGRARRYRWSIYRTFEDHTTFRRDDPLAPVLQGVALDHLRAGVADPALRAALTPDFPIGCSRVLVSTDYYTALGRPEVHLVTDPIIGIEPDAVVTAAGRRRPAEVIVAATGFAATDYLAGLEVVGRHGVTLRERWDGEPRAYLGMTVPDFPNLFMLYGPNTNQGGNSIVVILEAQAGYVLRALAAMDRLGARWVDVHPEVADEDDRATQAAMADTVWTAGCHNYFRTPSGRVVTQLPRTSQWYRRRVRVFQPREYRRG